MRVLLFRYLCDTGGVSSSMLLLGRQLTKRGVDCEYWFCQSSNRLAEFMDTGHATLAPVSALASRLERGDVDVVHLTTNDPAGPVVAMLAGRAKIVVTARGALADIWNRETCFAYTAISEGMATVNQPLTDVAIEVVRNAIEIDDFTPGDAAADGPPIVAFVGRTADDLKDFPRFTRIARRLGARAGGVRVWVADPHEATWDTLEGRPVERIAIERWGRVPHAEIPAFYRAVAASGGVVVMTSRSEGFGNVGPEAAACGARVAAPDVIGLREAIVDGVTGRLFPAAASDDDVAAMLDAWLAQPHDIARCAAAARAEFAPAAMVDAYLRIYGRREQLLAGPVAPAADSPELRTLRTHLVRQRGWRATAERDAAQGLAGEGRPGQAMRALWLAFRDAPRQFLMLNVLWQVAYTVLRMVRRGMRRRPAVAGAVGVR